MDEQEQPRPNRVFDAVFDALGDLEIEVSVTGFKSSEGDGRTAADIEREWAEQPEKETSVGTE